MRIKWIAAIAVLALTGCSKLTQENYKLLEAGMNEAEINEILGDPSTCSETMGTKSCIWGDEQGKHIKVRYAVGAAVIFSNQDL